ncbi:hypothetical protein FB567DRAFT_216958 [Paraphoma chrysanthemicola]|uniref:Tat pathway signal sequence n=1 Tax=Paraphoma chrysanthemicola TaxID=798071 RepID=A0A8K0QUX1_9PLEO|nr:hypothetical protein FB567DRAFT_216958 [Paraphoma chrysanthemicola]
MPDQKYTPLPDEENAEDDDTRSKKSIARERGNFINIQSLIVNVVVLGVGLFLGVYFSKERRYGATGQLTEYTVVPSPAFEAIASQPLIRTHHDLEGHSHKSPYQGYPTSETTARWMELMNGYSIRVPSKTLEALDLQSIPLNDESGDVWVSMNIYHHLHCLDSIRHQIAGVGCSDPHGSNANHTDSYDTDDEHYFPPHIDHCIETLRRRLICQPDLGVRAVAWNPEKPGVAFANNTVDSACVNWDAVQEWTRRHSFKEEERLISTPDGEYFSLFLPI